VSLKERIITTIDALADDAIATSKALYEKPELSGEEHESSRLLAEIAERHGFQVRFGVAGLPTAFSASRKPDAMGPRVAYLAEYDALPGIGHGCGHNFIGTASTFAAVALGSVIDEIEGDVALFGTPAEETDGGKIIMLDAGLFDDVSVALMVHPGMNTEIAYPSLACLCVDVEFFGKSAHAGAAPWKGINALDAMIRLFSSLDGLRSQLSPTARVPGVILNGGERANIVPDYTKAEFSLRGRDHAECEDILAKLVEFGNAAAMATGAEFVHGIDGNIYHEMRPDKALAGLFLANWRAIGGEEPANTPKPHGSLDIGNLSHRFPCLHPSIRIAQDDSVAGHTREFAAATQTRFAEEQLVRAIKALALTGLDVISMDQRTLELQPEAQKAAPEIPN
jgi:amidohydrolase